MKEQGRRFSCQSCGKEVECFPGEPPCEVLKGWLTVAYWKGPGLASQYSFCSFSCLKSWASAHVPQIPEVFLQSFKDNESQESKG